VHDSCRLITIEPLLVKLFAIVLEQRAARYLEQCGLQAPEQAGFRRMHPCADQLFTLDHLIRKYQADGQDLVLHAVFVDFRKVL
jgi:hypothetical protein